MYNQPPTLPSITTVGNGIEYSSSNGDIARIKQEKDVVHSLPPIRAMNNDNSNNNSIMSINQLCNDPDEEMKKAAAVLENMKQTALPPIEVTQLSNTHEGSIASPNSDGLIARFGELPFFRRTKTAYEQGKNTSPLIKYTTEMVESSVSIVIEKIPQLAQLDQYACRGLDKLGEMMDNSNNNNNNNNNNNYNNNNSSSNNNDISALRVAMVDGDDSSYGPCNEDTLMGGDESRKRKVRGEPARDSYRNPPSRTHRTSQSNGSQNSTSYVPYAYHNNNTVSTSTTSPAPSPSRWQQMLVGAGAAVGTARAVVSEESMKSLRYCLEWLQYATQHIEHQITILRDLIVKLTTPSSDSALIHSNASSTLSTIKKNIVDNLRKVIDIVSRYASKCLPDQAKRNVRSFILSLPTRWATINHSDLSASLSPLSSPQLNPINAHPNHQTADYARRLLSLATESLDMLLRVKGIFGESVERAEAWVERLKAIPPVGWSSQPTPANDYSYGQSSATLHSPPSSFRPRKSSNSSRVSNRKYNRTILVDDDDESIINNYDSDDSDDSEVENKRMEDNRSNRSLNSSKSPSPHGGLGKKRKKVAKKDDRMDLSEPF